MRAAAAGLLCLALAGCGVVWDSDGQRHALGIGMVSIPIPPADRSALVTGVDVYGVAVLATRSATGFAVGFTRERVVTMNGDHAIALDCLQCDLAKSNPRAGTAQEMPQ